MVDNGSMLMVHLMDGLGITKVVSGGEIFVDFHILRQNKVIKHWQSKHIRNSKLMVWDQKMEVSVAIESGDPLDDLVVRMSLLSNSSGTEGDNTLIAILEELFTTFAVVGPVSTLGASLTSSPSLSPMRSRPGSRQQQAMRRKDRIVTLVSVDPIKQGNPRIRLGVLYIPASVVNATLGIDSKRNFMNFKFQESVLKQQQENRQSRANSPAPVPLMKAAGDANNVVNKSIAIRGNDDGDSNNYETLQEKEDREFQQLFEQRRLQRQRLLEEAIMDEFWTIKLNINIDATCSKPGDTAAGANVGNDGSGAGTPATLSVVPIKTFVTLLRFHFPPKFADAVNGAIVSLQKEQEEKDRDPGSGDRALIIPDEDCEAEAGVFHGQSPIELLKLGYVHIAGQGRFLSSKFAWEYVKYCIDCNNRLIETPDAEELIKSDDALFIESEQPSKATVLGLMLWVEKTIRQCQAMIEFLFGDLNMDFALPGGVGTEADDQGQQAKSKTGKAAMTRSDSRDFLTAPMLDILGPYPTHLQRHQRPSSRGIAGSTQPPRPEPLHIDSSYPKHSVSTSHLSISLDGPLSASVDKSGNNINNSSSSSMLRSQRRQQSPHPAMRRSLDVAAASSTTSQLSFDLADDATLEQILPDEKEALLQKNMELVRDRLNYATKILTATMSVAGLPLDVQEKCATCLRDVLSNCSSLSAQIRVRRS